MKYNSEFITFNLPNGLRVIHKQTDRPVAHLGLFINAGSRDELENEGGLAHFIEHALFKGTKNRRAYHILNRLDSVGGELDAYTTKEMTCLYASFLKEYYNRALELIADISLHSTFPEKELEKEKEVILDEILVYQDSPSEQIFDDFESLLFKGHSLGKPILGTKESVLALNRVHIHAYQNRLYTASNMVISSVGNISVKRLKKLIEKLFQEVPTKKAVIDRKAFLPLVPIHQEVNRGSMQTHYMMGKASISSKSPKRYGMSLLNNILGGPAMNSILNLKVRERFGYTYHLESNYTAFSDSGEFSIYLASDPKYMDRCLSAIEKELKLLTQKSLSTSKLHLAKQQLKGQLAISRENNASLMLSYGKSFLMNNQVKTIAEIHHQIDQISASELLEIANQEFEANLFSTLTYQGN